MLKKLSSMLLAIVFMAGVGPVDADTVVLKSGEMFHTQRAWKENGGVRYYRNGQVVRVHESEVERLIHSPLPVEDKPLSEHRPSADAPSPPAAHASREALAGLLPDGAETGHLDLRWGQLWSQFEALTRVGTDPAYGGVEQYTQKQPEKRFGRASVDDIVYGFWQGSLYTIIVRTSNFLDFRDLKAEAFRRFGEGIQNRDHIEKYYWVDKGADRLLSYDYDTDAGYLWMRSQALHQQVKASYPN